ncbi:MAG: hypothetical protein KAG53_05640 [Endozoicomonadaceae bacterium]|nr:hypothetical protein [Endozoicomonadaceae bacterium]
MNVNDTNVRLAFYYIGGESYRQTVCDKYAKVKIENKEKVDTLQSPTHEDRTFVDVKSNEVCLIDNCFIFRDVSYVHGMTYFIALDSKIEKYVSPLIPYLLDRKVLVLKEAEPFDRKAEEKKLMETFYNAEGVLINKKFTGDQSPERLAHAGFEFKGDSDCDRVMCRFAPGKFKLTHVLTGWEPTDNPIGEHQCHFYSRPCIDMAEESKLPVMYDKKNNIVSGKVYDILIPREQKENICKSCYIVMHKDHKLNEISLDDITSIKLDVKVRERLIELDMESKKDNIIDSEYGRLVKEIIYTNCFYKQVEILNELNAKYKILLKDYLKKESEQLDNLKNNTADKKKEISETEKRLGEINMSLQICDMNIAQNEVDVVVDNVANFNRLFNKDRSSTVEEITHSSKVVERMKNIYKGRIYMNEELNKLIQSGDFAAFSANYSNGIDDNNLLKVATDMLYVYNNISNAIKMALDRPTGVLPN